MRSRCSPTLGVNSFKNFKVNQAKQFVACNHDGYVIGDAILFYLDENRLSLVGRPSAINWVQYNVETGGYDGIGGTGRAVRRQSRARESSSGTRFRGPTRSRSWRRCWESRRRTSGSSTWTSSPSRAGISAPCVTAWSDSPDGSCSVRGSTATRSATPLSPPVRSSGFDRWAREPIRPAASNRDGFRRRFRRSTSATS